MINNFIPFIALGYFLFFIKKNGSKDFLAYLIFLSFFVFSTNYTNYGLDFDIFRYLHRAIGITVILALFLKIIIHRINFFKDSVPQILILFFLILILSFLGNEVYMPHYVHYVRNFIFIAAIVVYLFYHIDSNERLEELFKFILVITLILSFFVIIETIFLNWVNFETQRIKIRRIALFFGNSNYLGYSLFPGLVISLFTRNKFYPVIPLVILFAIIATASRSMVIASFFAIFIHIFYQKYRLNYLLPSIGIMIIFFIVFSERVFINSHGSSARYVIANITMNIFKLKPINGIGYGQFRTKFRDFVTEDIIKLNSNEINDTLRGFRGDFPTSVRLSSMTKESQSEQGLFNNTEKMTHNDLLTVISELGLIGLVFVIFLFYKLYLELRRLLIHHRRYYYLSLSLIIGSLIFSMFHNNMTSFVFWFILFVPFIFNRNLNELDKI